MEPSGKSRPIFSGILHQGGILAFWVSQNEGKADGNQSNGFCRVLNLNLSSGLEADIVLE